MLVENRQSHRYFAPRYGVTPLEFRRDFWHQKMSPWSRVWRCLRDPTFIRFGTVPACDGQTNRQTDTRRQYIPR